MGAQKEKPGYPKTSQDPEPSYPRPLFSIPEDTEEKIFRRLVFLYGRETAGEIIPELEKIMEAFHSSEPPGIIEKERCFDPGERFTEKDVILITYGDLLRGGERTPLATLAKFCDTYLGGAINTLHILPFFPSSSDRGFAIIDFETVDPHLGVWQDIETLGLRYQLMFDGVINHVSSKSRWFQEFLNGNPLYQDFFIAFKFPGELTPEQRKLIFRPRTSDILTEYETVNGPVHVWTTFSPDQIDLNYKNPGVLLRVIRILLKYIRRGADIIRLDAVTYLWREPGTRCIHLRQTHEIIKLFRNILDIVAPYVALITETNVPHEENISYFGNGHDEAQMVYNFALPPLVLYTFYAEDATVLNTWAKTLEPPSETTAFLNFLDSHDGIGLMAIKNILSKNEIDLIIRKVTDRGGLVSYKTGENGQKEPYEVNITWFSALNPENDNEDVAFQVKRFVASRLIALVLKGVPGIYLHSLIGTKNDVDAVMATKSKRDINRPVIDNKIINEALKDPFSKISRINTELGRLMALRTKQRPFHPNGAQVILDLSPSVFSVLRISPERNQHLLSLINVSRRPCNLEISVSEFKIHDTRWHDLVSDMTWEVDEGILCVNILPYDVLWLRPVSEITAVTP